MTGLSKNVILDLLEVEHLERKSPRLKRRATSKPYTPTQAKYLTSKETLEQWKTLTIEERLERIKTRYPGQKHTAYRLR